VARQGDVRVLRSHDPPVVVSAVVQAQVTFWVPPSADLKAVIWLHGAEPPLGVEVLFPIGAPKLGISPASGESLAGPQPL
jgi:hypothetical protein